MGMQLRKSLVARSITSYAEVATLRDGDTVHRPYITNLSVNTYVKGVDVTIQDLAPTDETLTVSTSKEVSFYVDDIDQLQNRYDIASKFADQAAYLLGDAIDQAVLAEYANAAYYYDNVDFTAGAAGGIALDATNIHTMVTGVKAKLMKNNVRLTDPFMVVTPTIAEYIERYAAANGFNIADSTIRNGYAGDFLGMRILISNNLTTAAGVTHILAGNGGSIDLVVQKEPSTLITQPDKKIGKNFINWTLFGKKTFYEGARNLIDVRVLQANA
ncbi:MAG TPA: hypothetical protein VMR98_05075 [Candidatus Polarisedimenticolaceae bacterium]|nr:hypothetical protein [Candidatus Polarisedimenticolaceae bacterium]